MSSLEYNTIINLPITPEEIGVSLPPSRLRRIDFSALDFEALRRMCVEYVRTYFPDDFNDFILSNGFVMFMEIASAIGGILSERSDVIADEAFLPTAQSRSAVSQHLELIGQVLGRQTPATVSVECSVTAPTNFDIIINPGLIFDVTGPDGNPVQYELYSSPGDYNGNIIIPRGSRGVIAYGIEGKFSTPIEEISNGDINQVIEIPGSNVLDEPIFVSVYSGDTEIRWSRIDYIQLAGPNDKFFEVQHLDDRTLIKFGDNLTGLSPIEGQRIVVQYRKGGGIRGRIGTGAIQETRPIAQSGFATQNVLFRNLDPSVGGQDAESLEAAKRRAPQQYAAHDNAATVNDYINLSEGFSHPSFGSVAKASATIRTGIDADIDEIVEKVRSAPNSQVAKTYLLGNYVNRNIVELYILQENGETPAIPNTGLKEALKTKLSEINVFTDELRILDGSLISINIDARIVVSRNVDASIVKEQVNFAISNVFDIGNIQMGQGFNKSELITAIQSVPGVKSVTLFAPTDDYPSLRRIVNDDENVYGVGVNQLYVLGSRNLQFFYEQGNLNI